MNYQKLYKQTLYTLILISLASCSPKENRNNHHKRISSGDGIQHEEPIPSRTVKLTEPVKKLDVTTLYPAENRELLKKIDTKSQKQTTNIFYQQDQFLNNTVYTRRSPYEIFQNFQKQQQLSNHDALTLLQYALELNKIDQLDHILPRFSTASVSTDEALKAAKLLFSFDHPEQSYTLLEKGIKDTLEDKAIEVSPFARRFNALLHQLVLFKGYRLKKVDQTPYLLKAHQKFPENIELLSGYVNHLINLKQYSKAATLLTPYLKKDLKVLPLFEQLYRKSGELDQLITLYEKRLKLPEDLNYFNNYLSLLKKQKKLEQRINLFQNRFNTTPTLTNYLPLYHGYRFQNNNRALKRLMKQYYQQLNQKPEADGLHTLGEQYYQKGKYSESYHLINTLLLTATDSSYRDRGVILMLNILRYRPISKTVFKNTLPFNHPDLISGLLSLYQNSYHKTDLLKGLSESYHANDNHETITFLYNTFSSKLKDQKVYRTFILNYFSYLKTIQDQGSRKELVKLALKIAKETKDLELKLAILRDRTIQKSLNKDQILTIYETLLNQYRDDDKKFRTLMNENFSFIRSNYKPRQMVNMIYRYLDQFPKKEMLYDKLLSVLNRYRFYKEEIELYQRAMKRFDRKTWSAKFARFLLNRKFYNDLKTLNKELAKTEKMERFVTYMEYTFQKRYGKYQQTYNLFYEEIFLDALKQYPFNRKLVNRLLHFYNSFSKYYDRSQITKRKYEKLLTKYMFIFPELRQDYYRLKQRNQKMILEKQLNKIATKSSKTLPEYIYLAEGLRFMNRFEDAIAPYAILTTYYNTSRKLLSDGANLLKSLASSFYINDPEYLKKARLYFKRLTYLDQLNVQHYINLAELYYEQNQPVKATETLYRALLKRQNDGATFKAVANMFYDYYDYDNALTVLYQFRKNSENPNAYHPLVGRLFELKNQDQKAINEYITDLYHQPYLSSQSQKRLKTLYNKDQLKKHILKQLLRDETRLLETAPLFSTATTLLLTLNEKTAAIDLFQKSIARSKDRSILNTTATFFIQDDQLQRGEEALLKLLQLYPEDQTFKQVITFYQRQKSNDKLQGIYTRWLKKYPVATTPDRYLSVLDQYQQMLTQMRAYDKAIKLIQSSVSSKYIEKWNKINLNLQLIKLYQLNNQQQKVPELLTTLNQKYPGESAIIAATFKHYREQKQQKELTAYLKKLIKEARKLPELNYREKRSRIASYRSMLIEELKIAGDHTEVQNQFIEILKKDPRDLEVLKTAFYHAKNHKKFPRLEKFFLNTTKVSTRDHRFMLVMGHLYKLNQQYPEATGFFENARKLEPQNISIALELYRCHELAGNFALVYDFYLKLYQREQQEYPNSYSARSYLDKLFQLALRLKDQQKIDRHLFEIAGKPDNFYDTIKPHRIQFAAATLSRYNRDTLAGKYYEKYLYKMMKENNYISSSHFANYFTSLLKTTDVETALNKLFEHYNLINTLYSSKYSRYKKRSCYRAINYVVENYLPDQKQLFNRAQYGKLLTYLKKRRNSNNQDLQKAITRSFKKMGEIDLYFETVKQYKKYSYYRSEYLSFLRSHYQFKTLQSQLSDTGNSWELREKTALAAVFLPENRSKDLLEKTFNHRCTQRTGRVYGAPVNLYLNYIRKHNPRDYATLTANRCHYRTIRDHFIKHQEKNFALKLVDNNKDGDAVLTEKIAIYEQLKDYSHEGVTLFKELLAPDAPISKQLNTDLQPPSIWNSYINRYARYLAAGKLKDPLPYIVNTLELNPGSQSAYTSVARAFEDLKQYNQALPFYKYASTLRSNTRAKINLLRIHARLGNQEQVKDIREALLKKSSITTCYALFNTLKELKLLDIQFINHYNDQLTAATKDYNFNRLSRFYSQLTEYFIAEKNITRFLTMIKNNKQEILLPLYQSLLYDTRITLKERNRVLDMVIAFYRDNNDRYNLNRYLRLKFELQFHQKQYQHATATLLGNKALFNQMERGIGEYLQLRLDYAMNNLEQVVDYGVRYAFNTHSSRNSYDHGEYDNGETFHNSLDRLLTMVTKDQSTFGTQVARQLYAQIKTAPISLYQQKQLLGRLDQKQLIAALSNLMDRYRVDQLRGLQPLMIKHNLTKQLTLLVDRQFNHSYLHKTPHELNHSVVPYTINRLLKGDIAALQQQFKAVPLQERLLKSLKGELLNFPEEIAKKLLTQIPSDLEDLRFISGVLAIVAKDYQKGLTLFQSLKGLKFDLLKQEMIAELYYHQRDFNHEQLLYSVLKQNSNHKIARLSLFHHYKATKQPKKAFFILAKMGLNNYPAFGEMISGNLDGERRYGPYRSSYHYYGYNSIDNMVQRIAGSEGSRDHNGLKNFLNPFSKWDQEEISTFLTQQNQQYNSRLLALNIFKAKGDEEGYQNLLNKKD